ncbi:MAG: nucleotidyltransferase family protein [bacterium]|nr:nucleotidyltransferase family protein [bacterium]
MKAFILAGGFGMRMKGVVGDAPKVMLPVAGKPLLQHLVELCRTHGISDIMLSLHYRREVIRQYFGDGSSLGVNISYVEEKTPRGSGGALDEARGFLTDTFVMLNGDVMNQVNLRKLLDFHRQKGGIGTLVVHRSSHPFDSDMIETDKNQKVVRIFRPKPGEKFVNLGNAGLFVFEPGILSYVDALKDQSMEKDVIPRALQAQEPLYAYETDEYMKDIGTPERYEEVQRMFKSAQ